MNTLKRALKAALCGAALLLNPAPALAVDCGTADCGPHGECDPAGLAARCRCDEGYVSVSTYIPDRNFGAYCAPIGALPSEELCQDHQCGPHGVCVVAETDGGLQARCLCDLGYAATTELSCEDDASDDSEMACEDVACGKDSTCMVVADGLTCRCAAGGVVVLGARTGDNPPEKFGPACSFPLSAEQACGPDACGPKGQCVLGQAVVCDCAPGYEELDRTASDGKKHGYCLPEGSPEDPTAAPPPGYTLSAGDAGAGVDAGLQNPPAEAGAPPPEDAGKALPKPSKKVRVSGGCSLAPPRAVSVAWLWITIVPAWAFLCARRRRQSRRS